MIYFAQRAAGHIKIGYSRCVCTRLRHLSCAFGELAVLGVMEGNREQEEKIHFRFRRYRYYGEWFHPVPSLLRFIAENARPLSDDDAKTIHLAIHEDLAGRIEKVAHYYAMKPRQFLRMLIFESLPHHEEHAAKMLAKAAKPSLHS